MVVTNQRIDAITETTFIQCTSVQRGRSFVTNAFGAPVPVWIYGDEPEDLKSERAHLEEVMKALNRKSEEQAPARLSAVGQIFSSAPAPRSSEVELSGKFDALNQSLRALATFRRLQFGSSWPASRGAAARIGELTLHFFPQDGVIVSTYHDALASLTYVLDSGLLGSYYSWLERYGPFASLCGTVPVYTPVAYETGYLDHFGYGGGRNGRDFLNEFGITQFWIDRQRPGVEGSLVYITDGHHSRIIGIELYDLTRLRFALKDLPLSLDREDGRPSPPDLIARANHPCTAETSK